MSERDELQQILTELVTMPSAAEAERLAEHLRQRGVLAIANAESSTGQNPDDPRVRHGDRLRAFVVVAKRDLERAKAELYAMHAPEGDATPDEIEAAFDEPDDALGSRPGGALSRVQRLGDTVSPWLGQLFVLTLVGVVAWAIAAIL